MDAADSGRARARSSCAGPSTPRRAASGRTRSSRGSPSARPRPESRGRALAAAGVTAADVGYLRVLGAGGWAALPGLARVYRGAEPTCAVGSAAHVVGDTGAASGIAALIHAALCLAGRRLPPSLGLAVELRPWYVAPRARPWLCRDGARRLAAVGSVGGDGTAAHVVLARGAAAGAPLEPLGPYFAPALPVRVSTVRLERRWRRRTRARAGRAPSRSWRRPAWAALATPGSLRSRARGRGLVAGGAARACRAPAG